MGHRKTPEEVEWLMEHATKQSHAKTLDMFEERFGVRMTEGSLGSWMYNNGLRLEDGAKKCVQWTQEEKDYLAEIVDGRSYKAICGLMNERFERTFTLGQTKAAIARYGLLTGLGGYFKKGHTPYNKGKKWDEYLEPEAQEAMRRTTFKPGNVPPNLRPVGSERMNADGYLYVKVAEKRDPQGHNDHRDLWKLKHRAVWEEANGEVPEGHVLIFCDGDTANCTLGNLMCIPRETHGLMKIKGLGYCDRESAEAAVATAELMRLTNRMACRDRACKRCGVTFSPRYAKQRNCDRCLGRKK